MLTGLMQSTHAYSQSNQDSINNLPFFKASPVYNKKRFVYSASFGGAAYVAFSYGFYNSWYKNYPQSKFHLFNDMGEWNQMDKAGHVFSGYFQSLFCYNGAKWTGLSENKSIITGLLAGTLFQTTIEVMDGFSTEWGFSLGDIGANTIGLSAFYLQQKWWQDQRITLKESAWPRNYPNQVFTGSDGKTKTSLQERAAKL